MKTLLTLFVAATLAVVAPAALAEPRAAQTARVVLPDDVAPERYEIRLAPDAERLAFEGQARITIVVKRPTDRIVLNAAELSFRRVSLSGRTEVPRILLDETQQTAAFAFSTPLPPGRHRLEIDYAGKISQQPAGLFALEGRVDGRPSRALFTQFENSDARRFAPMWDEPAAKAVFSLAVETRAGVTPISNMPVARTERLGGDRVLTTFGDTPKMSSYLLFLAVGDFERIHRRVGETEIGVVALRGQAEKGRYALDAAARLLPFFNDYFGVTYPLPKLDIVAGPGQSQFFSAMENWGAVFGFERVVLLEPDASPAERQRVFTVTAHELAHQWFGNLVTMAWWDDLWLNEGFASWMENKAADHFHPEWRMSLQEMASRERAMRLDAGAGSHPVITPIRDVFAASNAFDAITYQKGQAVVRMLEAYVGEEVFRTAIRAYIARHAYGNTTTDQLWAEVDRVSPRPVTRIAHDFTLQAGVPLIRAEAAGDRIRLSQSRFATGAEVAGGWVTPVRVASPDGAIDQLVLVDSPRLARLAWPRGAPAVVGAGQSGYFRVRYAPELWRRVSADFPGLSPADQLGLIYDARALGETGLAPIGRFLELAGPAAASEEPVVLSAIANELAALGRAYPQSGGSAYRAFVRARLAPALARIGWTPKPGEPDNAPGLRDDLIRVLSDAEDPHVLAEARRRFPAALAGETGSGALNQTVQAVVARHADSADWAALHEAARRAASTTERNRLYRLLGSAKDPALADRALALALSGEPPPTTAPSIIAAVAAQHPEKAFDFALARRSEVEALLEPTSRGVFLSNLARGSRDAAMLPKLEALARTLPPSSRGEVRKAAAEIRDRIAFLSRLKDVDRWLAENPI